MSDLAVSGFCGMVGRGSNGYGKGVHAKSSAMRLKMFHQIGGNQGRPGIGENTRTGWVACDPALVAKENAES